nr:MAG TPA: hypothetical protein [Caudoviricetes sp.]
MLTTRTALGSAGGTDIPPAHRNIMKMLPYAISL